MFGVGLHFSPRDLLAVRRIAVPGALVQIAAATVPGALVARLMDWTWTAGLVFGLSLSVASTVVLVRALGAGRVMLGERELALAMARHAVTTMGRSEPAAVGAHAS